MPRRLILNADDFGLTPGINRAVIDLHQAGVLTSATLMATGPAFEDAANLARRFPRLGVGCHIVLLDGTPVLSPERIPSLLTPAPSSDQTSTLRPTLAAFVLALSLGRLREDDLYREAFAQAEKLQQSGIRVTHLDTHKHVHIFPLVTRVLLRVAQKLGIAAIRNPFEPRWNRRLGHGSPIRRLQIESLSTLEPSFRRQPAFRAWTGSPILSSAAPNPAGLNIQTTDGTLAISATGSLDRPRLRDVLTRLPDGVWEICCHPAYVDSHLSHVRTRLREHRETEREALLEVIPDALARDASLTLINYGDV